MEDVSIREAMLLWDGALNREPPRFAVRPLGHDDYYRYGFQVGACFAGWQREESVETLKLQLMVEAWHVAAFHGVPISMIHDELLCIPEYRDTLADDVLPAEFRGERS